MVSALRNTVAGGKRLEPAQYYGCTPVRIPYWGNTNTPYITPEGILVLSNSNGTYSVSATFGSGRADLPFTTPVWDKPFELAIKIVWKDKTGPYGIFGQNGNADGFTPLWYNNGTVSYMKNVGWPITWDGGGTVFVTKPINQAQILAMRYNGSSLYEAGVFENGSFVVKKQKTSTGIVPGGGVLNIGSNRGSDSCLYADVDLNFCYIRFDGKLLWEGVPGAFKRVGGGV